MNEMERTIDEKLEIMRAFLEGKALQFKNKKKEDDDSWENTKRPTWSWDLFDYRIKPDEPKRPMTCRQLAELMAKGYGELMDKYTLFVGTHLKYDVNRGCIAKDNVLIRAWGSDEWIEPTVDVYEEYISKWNRAFGVDVSKTEKTTASEESSATVSKEGSVGVHKRTPQEIADFFDCYVAMDEDGYWYLYSGEPILRKGDMSWQVRDVGTEDISSIRECFFLLNTEEDHNWRTLYRPHMEPLVMEAEDD